MSQAADMLREFHARIPDHDKDVRERLHFEEHGELELALEGGDRLDIARELADVVYVCFGTALVYGIDLDIALAEVHRANMAKGTDLDRHGKVKKPAHFTPPYMGAAITDQRQTREGRQP